MGCGCKGDKAEKQVTEKVEFNLKSFALNLTKAIAMTALFIVISPIILLIIWYIAVSSVFGKNADLGKMLSFKFNKKNKIESEEEVEPFNEDNYELMDVDRAI